MTLTDIMSKTRNEVLDECRVIDEKVHTDDNGNIKMIEMKYQPRDIGEIKVPTFNK